MAVAYLLKLRNKRRQRKNPLSNYTREIAAMAISLFFHSMLQFDLNTRLHANITASGMCPCSSADRASALLEP
jgi:hypothetical protein